MILTDINTKLLTSSQNLQTYKSRFAVAALHYVEIEFDEELEFLLVDTELSMVNIFQLDLIKLF
jgi:hypothetical protein